MDSGPAHRLPVQSQPFRVAVAAAFALAVLFLLSDPFTSGPRAQASQVQSIAAGGRHTCAVLGSGDVSCWGDNQYGALGDDRACPYTCESPVTVAGLPTNMASVAAGHRHTCAITAERGLKCWGRNNEGELGDGTTVARTLPVDVLGLETGVVAVSAGYAHTCAAMESGVVKCWGRNDWGQLGDGTTEASTIPVEVQGLSGSMVGVAAGMSHTCAASDSGTVQCWGSHKVGQLGDPGRPKTGDPSPTTVVNLTRVVTLDAGDHHTCALVNGGSVECWGEGQNGQLGDGRMMQSATPVEVEGLGGNVTSMAVGGNHTCAVLTAGGAQCWGSDFSAQLGDGRARTTSAVPVQVVGLPQSVSAVGAGREHTCAVLGSGNVACWGADDYGQVGDGTTRTPTQVKGLVDGAVAVSAGGLHTCALDASGSVLCWGHNLQGQQGDGTTIGRATATLAALPGKADAVSAGGGHTCALMAENGVMCWGNNQSGQLGDPFAGIRRIPIEIAGLTNATAVASGSRHSCALMDGGGVKCWGSNDFGQLGNDSKPFSLTPIDVVGVSDAIAIDAGQDRSCAVMQNGNVKCWGAADLGNGTSKSGPIPVDVINLEGPARAVSVGYWSNCLLLRSGSAQCWGWNGGGALGDGTFNKWHYSPVAVTSLSLGVAVVTGGGHACGLTAKGEMLCWGSNVHGQLGVEASNECFPVGGPCSTTAVTVPGLDGVTEISAGHGHTCAVAASAGVKCWGSNSFGQIGNGAVGNVRLVPALVAGLDMKPSPPVTPCPPEECPTPVAMPCPDFDADTVCDGSDQDDDDDGCSDILELGDEPRLGGSRNQNDFWDFFDTPDEANHRDQAVSAADLARVVARFGRVASEFTTPLSRPTGRTYYHSAFDRSAPESDTKRWRSGAPDGSIGAADVAMLVAQFGHTCVAAP